MEKLNNVAQAQDPAKIETSTSFIVELGQDIRRLLGNKILVFDCLAMSFFLFATTNGSYKAKFVELQFLTSASAASLFSGSATMIGRYYQMWNIYITKHIIYKIFMNCTVCFNLGVSSANANVEFLTLRTPTY